MGRDFDVGVIGGGIVGLASALALLGRRPLRLLLIEAEKAGYALPGDMKAAWIRYQKERAQRWTPHGHDWPGETRLQRLEAARHAQAYRLLTLALAGAPDMGAMNRLRESGTVSIGERWMLASAYKLAGKPDVALALAEPQKLQAFVFTDGNPYTFGSLLRDRAIVLMGLTLLGRDAETEALLQDISEQLSDDHWYNTQAVAFALVLAALSEWTTLSRRSTRRSGAERLFRTAAAATSGYSDAAAWARRVDPAAASPG